MVLVTRQAMSDDDGTFTSGTAVNKAFVDQIYGQVDAQTHSATNPLQTPIETTDEVVLARDSFDSLADRLDDMEGGSGATLEELQDQLTVLNLVRNPDLDYWSAGNSTVPDGYNLAGTGVAIVKTGPAQVDTFTFGAGTYTAKVTYGSATVKYGQTSIATISASAFTRVRSKTVSASVIVKTSVPSQCKLVIDDGVGTTASTYHPGDGTTQVLTVSRTLSGTATRLQVYLQMDVGGSAYVAGLVIVFGGVAPQDWTYGSWFPGYTSTLPGQMLPEAQTSHGIKTFARGHPLFEPGASTDDEYAAVLGTSFVSVNSTVNTGAVETVFVTRDVPANTFDVVGRVMRIRSTIIINGSTANPKTLRFYWGNNLVGSDHLCNASAAGHCILTVDVVKSSADAQRITVQYNNSLGGDNADNDIFIETRTDDDGSPITWEIRALTTTGGDMEHYTTYEWIG